VNEVNVYGYNMVSALRRSAIDTASYKLAELLNGVATAITSGGDLEKFFEKKAQSLLFDYRLEREKYTRMAETFMDIYISVVIAAPIILMLLLMMIKISGLGIQLTTQMLTLIIVGGVTVINIVFITFLQLKQPDS
jgi:flagellar protein FlaJ